MKEEGNIAVVIADEHPMCRAALRNLIERESGLGILGEASNGEEALAQVMLVKPDLLLMDFVIQRFPAMEVLRRVQARDSKVPVLVLAESLEKPLMIEMLKFGAKGFLLKESAPAVLFRSIRAVAGGEYWIARSIIGDLIEAWRYGGIAGEELRCASFSLTPREIEIIAEVAEGSTNRNIAGKLSIAEQTVKHHLTSIFQKLGISSRLELAVLAMHHGIHG